MDPDVVVGIAEIGINLDRLPAFGDGLVEPPGIVQRSAEIDVTLSARAQLDGFAKALDCSAIGTEEVRVYQSWLMDHAYRPANDQS